MARWPWIVGIVGAAGAGAYVLLRPGSAQAGEGEAVPASPVRNPDPDDAYSLARLMVSEEGQAIELVRVALAWACINMANKRGVSVTALLKQNTGGYSGQGGGKNNWYASTAQEARDMDVELAARLIAGEIPDPTGGATNFDNPRTQDWLFKHGKVSRDADGVAADRRGSGLALVTLPGVDPYDFRLWSPIA